LAATCQDADYDNDGDADAADIEEFVNCLSGADVPAAAECVP
jgi:hypothetical protein